jgi:hypothetical protein
LHSQDWYQGPLKQPSEEDLQKSVYILKKSLSKLGFIISEVNCSLPYQVQEQRARNEKMFCSQETFEKACVVRVVEDFLGNDLDAEDLEESLEIPETLINEVKKSASIFQKTKEYLRNLRKRQVKRRISLSPSVIQQLKECSLTPAMILHLKECINLQKKPWKDLSLHERRELFYKISGTSIDLIAPRVILKKVEKE